MTARTNDIKLVNCYSFTSHIRLFVLWMGCIQSASGPCVDGKTKEVICGSIISIPCDVTNCPSTLQALKSLDFGIETLFEVNEV